MCFSTAQFYLKANLLLLVVYTKLRVILHGLQYLCYLHTLTFCKYINSLFNCMSTYCPLFRIRCYIPVPTYCRAKDSLLINKTRNRRVEKKRKALKKKSLLLLRSFFAVTRIRLIWLDIFLARVNREEKGQAESHADWTNRHILEKWTVKKKRQNCQFPVYYSKESMTQQCQKKSPITKEPIKELVRVCHR